MTVMRTLSSPTAFLALQREAEQALTVPVAAMGLVDPVVDIIGCLRRQAIVAAGAVADLGEPNDLPVEHQVEI
ncbi:MAG: hypothetical protein J2P50_05395 [Hyphomicrobiaceae bacterium]|nr:hypothetical protein [Hyphomicrobiaceae bacterium]